MSEEFPIYRVEFSIYAEEDRSSPMVRCVQDMMMSEKYADHDIMYTSLTRMVKNLGDLVCVGTIVAWDGFIAFDRMDTWCLHWQSHYTYQRFATDHDAMVSFMAYIREHQPEVETHFSQWHVCHCITCKNLNRTMMLHRGVSECLTCACVS